MYRRSANGRQVNKFINYTTSHHRTNSILSFTETSSSSVTPVKEKVSVVIEENYTLTQFSGSTESNDESDKDHTVGEAVHSPPSTDENQHKEASPTTIETEEEENKDILEALHPTIIDNEEDRDIPEVLHPVTIDNEKTPIINVSESLPEENLGNYVE